MATTTNAAAVSASRAEDAPGVRRRGALVAYRVMRILVAVFFMFSASPKLIGHSSAAESFDRIGFGDWFMYLTGVLEMSGAIALLIPVLAGLAGTALVGLLVGAFVTQVTVFDGENAATPIIVMVPLAIVAWVERRRTAELFAPVARRA